MSKRKILAIVLVLAMVLTLPAVAMADNPQKPVKAKDIQTPQQFQSVTIGGETASFQVDGYGTPSNVTWDNDHVFIRAMMPATNTEEFLKALPVTITMSSGYTITGGTLRSSYTPTYNNDTKTYTFSGVDLLNTSYTIVLSDSSTYTIAAGLNDSNHAQVLINTLVDDYLGVSSFKYNNGLDAVIYRVTLQNPCMGNPYFVANNNSGENGWTFCSYYIKSINVSVGNTNSVPISFIKDSDESITGDISNVTITGSTNVSATINLNGSTPVLTVTKNGNSRSYSMIARLSSPNYFWVTYGISFDELHSEDDEDYYYEGSPVKEKADEIEEAAIAYFDTENGLVPYGEVYVPVGSTAMDIIQAFMDDAGYPEYDPDSTYISSINGLAAFDTTGMDGWMYTDSATGWSASCHLPNVGAADYYLSAGDHITWFYTIDYTQYTNW